MKLVGSNAIGLAKLVDGKNQYFYIRYSKNENGLGMTEKPQSDTLFIGILVSQIPTPSENPGDYTWTKFIGVDGVDGSDGANGRDGVAGKDGVGLSSTKVEYARSLSGTTIPTTGWTVSIPNTSPGEYMWTKTTWTYTDGDTEIGYSVSRIGIDGNTGEDGVPGKDGVGLKNTLIQYAGSTSGTSAPTTGWGTTIPSIPAGNYMWTKTTWTYTDDSIESGYSVSRIGANGTDGVPGKDGADGKTTYTWIRYADNESGEGISNNPTGKPYIGFAYNKTTSTESNNPLDYSWSLIKGADGIGIPGAPGKDGVTTYTWIKYANVADGTGLYDTPKVSTQYIGIATNKTTATESTNKTDYTWSKFIGSDGESSYTWIRYSPNADGSSMTTEPTGTSKYIGVSVTNSPNAPTDYKQYSWALIKGADGRGVKSTSVSYQKSASGTTTPTGSWVATIPSVPKGEYLWTRMIITYTDSTTSTTYNVSYQGVDGSANIVGLLTNEAITLPANASGNVSSYAGANGVFEVYDGITKKTGTSVTYSVLSKTNIEVTISTTGGYTVTSLTRGLSVMSGYATLRAVYGGVTIDKQISVAKSTTGGDGASATSYWITTSNNIIGKSQTGVINPTIITFKGFSKTGTANSVAYSGRFIIQTSTNGTTYTTRYTSSANQSSYTYTIPADSLFVKCKFYQAGGTSVLLDEQTVPVVETAEGIEIGNRNWLVNTVNPSGVNPIYTLGSEPSISGKLTIRNGWTKVEHNTGSSENYYRFNAPKDNSLGGLKTGQTYTIEMTVKGNGRFSYRTQYKTTGNWITTPEPILSYTLSKTEEQKVKYTFKVPDNATAFYLSIDCKENIAGNYMEFYRPMLVEGNIPIPHQPAPEDARNYKAWSNSADGKVDFTKIKPNENLFVYKDINNLAVSTNLVSQPRYKGYSLPVKEGEKYTIYRTQDTNVRWGVYWAREEPTVGTEVITAFRDDTQPVNTPKIVTVPSEANWMFIYLSNNDTTGETIQGIKLEKGTEPTIYTTNPQDSLTGSVPQYIGFSPLDSDNPEDYAWMVNPEWAEKKAEEDSNSVRQWASSEITQTSESIMQSVQSNYVSIDELGEYRESVSTEFEQTAKDFNFIFNEIRESVENVGSDTETKFQEISKYIRFEDGDIILGASNSDSSLRISMDEMAFIQGGNKVAYFSGQSFYIDKGIIVEKLQVGQHAMVKGANGHTSFEYTG